MLRMLNVDAVESFSVHVRFFPTEEDSEEAERRVRQTLWNAGSHPENVWSIVEPEGTIVTARYVVATLDATVAVAGVTDVLQDANVAFSEVWVTGKVEDETVNADWS